MADANIRAVITAEDKASSVIQGFSTKTIAVGSAIGVALGNVVSRGISNLTSSIGDAVKRVDTLNNANRTFENMGFKAVDVKKSMENLNKSILGLPTSLDQAVQGVELLSSANNNVDKAQGVFTALNDAILGFGGTAYDVQGAVLQLSQDIAGGRLQAQTWNSLLQNGLGPTLAAMARKMGITTQQLKEGLSDGSISIDKFQDSLIEMDRNGGGGLKSLEQIAKDSTNGIGTSFANAKTAIVRSLASIIQGIGQARIAEAITTIGITIATLITWAGKLFNFIATHQPLLFAVGGAFAGIAIAIGVALAPAIAGAIVAFGALIIAAAPFILIGAAIGLIAYEIMKNWETLKGWFFSFWQWIKGMFFDIWSSINGVWQNIWSTVKNTINNIIEFFKGIPKAIGAGFNAIKDAIIAPFDWAFKHIKDGIEDVKNAYHRVVDDIKSAPSGVKKGVGKILDKINPFAEGTNYAPGGLSLVGERGPELVNLPAGSQVIPNSRLGQVGSTNIVVNIGMYAGTEVEKRKIATQLMRAYNDAQSARGMA